MKNRILTIALALSLLAVAFTAVPTTAAVTYTGGITTTDSEHEAKTAFVEGEAIYVDVELMLMGDHVADDIEVWIYNTYTWGSEDWLSNLTNDPAVGWYNSSQSTPPDPMAVYLADWEPDLVVCEVIAYVYGIYGYQEFARTQITVMKERLTIEPDLSVYYPGQTVEITLVTGYTDDFYVQVVNETEVTKVNWTSQETGDDHFWSTVWSIPFDFADGYYDLRVRDEATHAIWFSFNNFQVLMYELEVLADRYGVLPGETVGLTYMITQVATGALYYGPTIEYQTQYFNVSGNQTNVSGTLPSGGGSYNYTVPTDIALWSDVDITFWANESDRSAETELMLYISVVYASLGTDSYEYTPGEPVFVMVYAYAAGDDYWDSLEGADVDVSVYLNDTAIPAYGATDLVTGVYGSATYTFNLIDTAPAGVYTITATVSKLGMTSTVVRAIEVLDGGWMSVEFDRDYYTGGELATISFKAVLNDKEMSAAFSYTVYTYFGILANGNSSGEDVTVMIPMDFYGWIWVDAEAYVGGLPKDDYDDAYVDLATLTLVPTEDEYRPGETIVWNWEITTGLETAALTYWIWDNDGVLVDTGAPVFAKSGTIEYDVPLEDVSGAYGLVMRLTSAGGYVEAESDVELVADYELILWVEKSKYASGEFKPGDTVTIRYEIHSYLAEDLPLYALWISVDADPKDFMMLVTEPEGSFEYVLPDDASTGLLWIYAEAYDGVAEDFLDEDEASFVVNSQLSGWDRSVGGMAAIDFLILVLLIVMILLLIIVPFLKARPPKAAATEAPAPVVAEAPKT